MTTGDPTSAFDIRCYCSLILVAATTHGWRRRSPGGPPAAPASLRALDPSMRVGGNCKTDVAVFPLAALPMAPPAPGLLVASDDASDAVLPSPGGRAGRASIRTRRGAGSGPVHDDQPVSRVWALQSSMRVGGNCKTDVAVFPLAALPMAPPAPGLLVASDDASDAVLPSPGGRAGRASIRTRRGAGSGPVHDDQPVSRVWALQSQFRPRWDQGPPQSPG